MFKKFFRKVRETVKKVAPIAAPIAGAYLGPLYGAGIGALLGQYGGTKGSIMGALGGGLGGILGNMAGGQSGMNLLTKGGIREALKTQVGLTPKVMAQNVLMGPESRVGGGVERVGGLLKHLKNPYVAGGLLSAAAGLMNKDDDDDNRRDNIEIGSQGQLGDMRVADIEYLPANVPVFPSGYAGYAGYANGGIVSLAEGGMPPKNVDDFPRKNGKIEGPGTMTSDDIPAMLSDGEFVTKAVSVIGAGVREGADTIEEAREKGSDFFYQQQEDLAKLGERLVNGN